MRNLAKLAFLIIIMIMPLSTSASTGDLQGVCKGVVLKLFSQAELIGMLGGSMERFDVSGFIIDLSDNTAYEFDCLFPTSHHHKPEQFLLRVFGKYDKDPIRLARETFEARKKQFITTIGKRREMAELLKEKSMKETEKAAKNSENSVNY